MVSVKKKPDAFATQSPGEGLKLQSFAPVVQRRIMRDRLSVLALFGAVISLLFQVALIGVSWRRLPPEVPIFYSRIWGDEILASPIFLWSLPATLVIFSTVNFLIAAYLVSDNPFLVRVLVIVTLVIAMTTLWNNVKIISLVA